MKIVLMRHGTQEYEYNDQGKKLVSNPDVPLSELGKIQMDKVSERLVEEGITLDAVYTSPYLRAKQSAEILANLLSIPNTNVIDGLKDDDPNSAEGRTYEELAEIGGDIYAHPFSENQESLEHLVKRTKEALVKILSDASECGYNSVAIVSHGDPLSALDWNINHLDPPSDYVEMRDASYLQQAEIREYINPYIGLSNEGNVIRVKEVDLGTEGFRDPRREVV